MPKEIKMNDNSLNPYTAESYADLRGIVEFGNLGQFAPYEGGYSFFGVINSPYFMRHTAQPDWVKQLNDAFVKAIEQEFRGLDGIEDITTETMEITDGISNLNLISKTVQPTAGTFSMRVTEKVGTLYTKYVSTYLRFLKDPRTLATTYGGLIGKEFTRRNFAYEVFNFLYIVTDSTMRNVEKAFLILNAQPTTASYSELFNSEKGSVENKEIQLQFNGFAIDGSKVNLVAKNYLDKLHTKVQFNSYDHDYQVSIQNEVKTVETIANEASLFFEHKGSGYESK